MIINPTMLINGSSKGDNEDMFIDLSGYTPIEGYSGSIFDKELLAVTDYVVHTDSSNINDDVANTYVSIYTENNYAGDNYSSHDICSIALCIVSTSNNNGDRTDYYTPFVRFKIPSTMKTYYENKYAGDHEKFNISGHGCCLFVKN